MGKIREFGIGFENLHARDFPRVAKRAESAGFSTFWVPEDYFFRGAFTIAAAIAGATSRIKIGIGVLNPYTRHPALAAMEFAALDELSGGRGILGIGAGLRGWIEGRLRIPYRHPHTAMRESIEIVRAMFGGAPLSYAGRMFQTDGVRMNFTPARARIPIHLGVMAPRNLELAGEMADGVLFSVMTTSEYLGWALEHVKRGLAKAGRSLADFQVGGYVLASISEDERAARDAVKPLLAALIALMAPQPDAPILALPGLAPETVRAFGAAMARGESPAATVTDWMIDTFTIAGSPSRCREHIARLAEAGLTSPILFELPGVSAEDLIGSAETHLLPHFL
jgi:5,10-methylenetetrahydromethanopterin reductase